MEVRPSSTTAVTGVVSANCPDAVSSANQRASTVVVQSPHPREAPAGPVSAATTALHNLAADPYANSSRHTWSDTPTNHVPKTSVDPASAGYLRAQSEPEDLTQQRKSVLNSPSSSQQSTAKLDFAPSSSQAGQMIAPTHHVESVIKTVPSQHHDLDQREEQGQVLAEMVNMHPMHAAPDPMAYSRVVHKPPSMYDPNGYAGLGLPSAAHVLTGNPYLQIQQPYYALDPNSATREYYARHYSAGPSMESTEDVIARIQSSQQINNYQRVTVDLPSPVDSGIGNDLVTPKDPQNAYSYGGVPMQVHEMSVVTTTSRGDPNKDNGHTYSPRLPPANEPHSIMSQGRITPVQIPKIITNVGFFYTLEAPISISVRREDDKMTYINKGQFYTISLDYVPDPNKPLKSLEVKSMIALVFREERPYEEDERCWQFWYQRQHSLKQRIIDVDTKNSSGIGAGGVEECASNAVALYWRPNEQPAKVNIAVHCLSTDFSNQKGVKGLPLHLQVDTYDENVSKTQCIHRGFCQIKVFCDKGANRKMLHEQRREDKRRLQGRKKNDCEYHDHQDRSEFYHMSDLRKPPVLYIAPEDMGDRFPTVDSWMTAPSDTRSGGSPCTTTVDMSQVVIKPEMTEADLMPPPVKKNKHYPDSRVLIFVQKPGDAVYTPVHVVPPTLNGLMDALLPKLGMGREQVNALYRQNAKGITAHVDDDMVALYSNEDSFRLTLSLHQTDPATYDLSLVEIDQGPSAASSSAQYPGPVPDTNNNANGGEPSGSSPPANRTSTDYQAITPPQ